MKGWTAQAVNRVQQGWNGEKLPEPEEKKPRKNEEDRIQAAFVRAFAVMWPREWDAKRMHAVPNGGKRGKTVAAMLKRTGTVAGVWDLQLTIPRGKYAGLWLECKATTTLTDEQKAFQKAHEEHYAFAVFYSVEEGIKAVQDYLALPASFNAINY